MFQWAKQNMVGIIFFYVADQEASKNAKTYQLEQRYSNCTTISGTRSHHCFNSIQFAVKVLGFEVLIEKVIAK